MGTLILTRNEVRDLLDLGEVITAVENAFRRHGNGSTRMPPKVYLPLPEHDGDFRAMPVYFPATDGAPASAGVKWVNAHPENPARHGLPSVLGVFILSDPETARPLAIMDATEITAARTGAAAAVATKFLGPDNGRTLALIGCGAQAPSVLAAHLIVMQPSEIRLSDRDPAAAERLAAAHPALPCETVELAIALRADVVCTMTPSRKGFVQLSALDGPTHINAMGADAPGKQELDVDVLRNARVFLDDTAQGSESGEVNLALSSGAISAADLAGTLGEVVAGTIAGRAEAQITVFDSTGLAVQDLAVAGCIYEKARAAGIGIEVDLSGV
jgi:alanine dehydrogenase